MLLATALLAAAFLTAFVTALAGAFFAAAAFLAGAFFAPFFAGVNFAALDTAQRFRCASAMRFRAAALRLGLRVRTFLTATFSVGAFFDGVFAGVGFAASFAALAAAQRFFCASAIRFRVAGLSLRLRLSVCCAGAAAFATDVAGLTPDKRERTSWSFAISASIASMIKFVSIAASLGDVFVYRNTIPRRKGLDARGVHRIGAIMSGERAIGSTLG